MLLFYIDARRLGGQSKYLWVTNTKAIPGIPPLIISIIKDDVINILPVYSTVRYVLAVL